MKRVDSFLLDGLTILIVGPISLKNSLLNLFLQKEGGAKCFLRKDLPSREEICQFKPNRPDIMLWDMHLLDQHLILTQIKRQELSGEISVALLDLASESGIEAAALQQGIRGFFYWNDDPRLLLNGLRHIQKGRMWISRAVLQESLGGLARPVPAGAISRPRLTQREKDVLRLTMRGYRNAEIAKSLAVSPNTVKSHLHQAFRKINVSSRMQAAKWAEHHLANAS